MIGDASRQGLDDERIIAPAIEVVGRGPVSPGEQCERNGRIAAANFFGINQRPPPPPPPAKKSRRK
ncbi:hypothetical protein [Nannocystis radixulma]|uniref:Uncharacterized protein n=1 Tax=Nannocystis radixulma TaxID=2995305 RepID=A0ABT5B8Y0_9BACT|nr:hypothetical protein [Nannocystis radixulma]MDC0670588.1 hypothetical protein [Nannocystis radixulma]